LPGEKLGEIQLAEELEVSRTPVREALLRLATLGLLEKDTHRGARVASPSLAQLVEVYEVRESLEGTAARLFAIRATEAQRGQLRATWTALEAARRRGDELGVRVVDFSLHREIIRGGNNEYLGGAGHAEALMLLAYLVRDERPRAAPAVVTPVVDPHAQVMDAIERRDGEAAEAAMRAHVRGTRETLIEGLAPDALARLYPSHPSEEAR
jgi:DNA-binding GntR family transcriptional regulator